MGDIKSERAEKYFSLGVSAAFIYGFVVFLFSFLCFMGIGPFEKPDDLNSLGDFLAGVFSPLAFLFFLISVLIQREEFRLARGEMRDSRKELENQVSQMKFSGMAPFYHEQIRRMFDGFKGDNTLERVKKVYLHLQTGPGASEVLLKDFINFGLSVSQKKNNELLPTENFDINNNSLVYDFSVLINFSQEILSYVDTYKELCGLYELARGPKGDEVFKRSEYGILGYRLSLILDSFPDLVIMGPQYI